MIFRSCFFITLGLCLTFLTSDPIWAKLLTSVFLLDVIYRLISGGFKVLTDKLYTEQRSLQGARYVLVGINKVDPAIVSNNRFDSASKASQILKRFT